MESLEELITLTLSGFNDWEEYGKGLGAGH